MKKIVIFLVSVFCLAQLNMAGCKTSLQYNIQLLNNVQGNIEQQLDELDKITPEFRIIDEQCQDEVGNMAALYVDRIQQMKTSLNRRLEEKIRQQQITTNKAAEQKKLEQKEAEERQQNRINNKLVYMSGYGKMPNGEIFNVVSTIKGQIKNACPQVKYTSNSDDAFWSVQVAIDMNGEVRQRGEKYMATVAPIIVITNLITNEILYEGTGLESVSYAGIVDGIAPLDEASAIRTAFRKACVSVTPLIIEYLNSL